MTTDSITDEDQMMLKLEDILTRLYSMLTYLNKMKEHAINTSCSEDKIKEPIINFFEERIKELEEKIQYTQNARIRLLDGY
jgi:redox-regulated HSP33 family molecular chaperone